MAADPRKGAREWKRASFPRLNPRFSSQQRALRVRTYGPWAGRSQCRDRSAGTTTRGSYRPDDEDPRHPLVRGGGPAHGLRPRWRSAWAHGALALREDCGSAPTGTMPRGLPKVGHVAFHRTYPTVAILASGCRGCRPANGRVRGTHAAIEGALSLQRHGMPVPVRPVAAILFPGRTVALEPESGRRQPGRPDPSHRRDLASALGCRSPVAPVPGSPSFYRGGSPPGRSQRTMAEGTSCVPRPGTLGPRAWYAGRQAPYFLRSGCLRTPAESLTRCRGPGIHVLSSTTGPLLPGMMTGMRPGAGVGFPPAVGEEAAVGGRGPSHRPPWPQGGSRSKETLHSNP